MSKSKQNSHNSHICENEYLDELIRAKAIENLSINRLRYIWENRLKKRLAIPVYWEN